MHPAIRVGGDLHFVHEGGQLSANGPGFGTFLRHYDYSFRIFAVAKPRLDWRAPGG